MKDRNLKEIESDFSLLREEGTLALTLELCGSVRVPFSVLAHALLSAWAVTSVGALVAAHTCATARIHHTRGCATRNHRLEHGESYGSRFHHHPQTGRKG